MRRLYIIMSILTVALTVLPSDARNEQRKTRKEIRKEQRMEEVHSLLTSGRYEIVVSKAFPMSGRMINLTSKYSLQVRQDTLVSNLPYFGRAYSIPYGGGDGLNFEVVNSEEEQNLIYRSDIRTSSVDKDSSRTDSRISIRAVTDEDVFDFNITVYAEGGANISVTSNQRQPISYSGEVRALPQN